MLAWREHVHWYQHVPCPREEHYLTCVKPVRLMNAISQRRRRSLRWRLRLDLNKVQAQALEDRSLISAGYLLVLLLCIRLFMLGSLLVQAAQVPHWPSSCCRYFMVSAGKYDVHHEKRSKKLRFSKAEKNSQEVSLIFSADLHGRTKVFIRL